MSHRLHAPLPMTGHTFLPLELSACEVKLPLGLAVHIFRQQVINDPADDPIFSISFPANWVLEIGAESVSASSKDELANTELVVLEAGAFAEIQNSVTGK
ncbi:MAG: hypothetical protein ACJAVK_000396 [Akkermansiaceae bacterium]|jgi:hypothetical protein